MRKRTLQPSSISWTAKVKGVRFWSEKDKGSTPSRPKTRCASACLHKASLVTLFSMSGRWVGCTALSPWRLPFLAKCLRTCVMHAQLWSKARRLPRMGGSAVGRLTTRQVSVRLHLGVQSVVAIGVDTPRIVASLCASTMTQQMDYSAVIAGLATSITLTRGPNMETWGRSNVRPDPWFFLFRTSFPHICTQWGI